MNHKTERLLPEKTKDIEDVLQVNLMGTIYGIKYFIPGMLKQKDECYIINSSAGAGIILSAYCLLGILPTILSKSPLMKSWRVLLPT